MADEQEQASANTEDPSSPNRSLSLEQALLAPLDSILKAQLHSARSFLNMLLQLGYPHNHEDSPPSSETTSVSPGDSDHSNNGKADGETGDPSDKQTTAKKKIPSEPYHLEFAFRDEENNQQLLRVPALSLVPISPLAVDSARFELEMAVQEVFSRTQMRSSSKVTKSQDYDEKKRPWFLVEQPLDIRGEIVPPTKTDASNKKQTESTIKIDIQMKSIPMPSGLNKLLATLTAMSEVQDPDKQTPAQGQEAPDNTL